MVKYIVVIIYILLFGNSYCGIILNTEFQDTPSKIIIKRDRSVSGITADIINLIEKNSEYRFKYKRVESTLTRIEENLKTGKIDVYFGMFKSKKREENIIYIEPLYDINYGIVTYIENYENIESIEDLKKVSEKKQVLTLFGSVIGDYLTSKGIKYEAGAKSVGANFHKIISRKADYFIYHDKALIKLMENKEFKGKLKLIKIDIKKDTLWLVASKKVESSIVSDLSTIIKKLKTKEEWNKIIKN